MSRKQKRVDALRSLSEMVLTSKGDVSPFRELMTVDVIDALDAMGILKVLPQEIAGTLSVEQKQSLKECIITENDYDYKIKMVILDLADVLLEEDNYTRAKTYLPKETFWELLGVTNAHDDIRDLSCNDGDEPILYWGSVMGKYVFLAMGV